MDSVLNSPDHSIWRYLPLLPVSDPGYPGTSLRTVGWTPLYDSVNLMKELGLKRLWLKDDGRNPTGSFKDRASAVVIAHAKEIKADVVVTASTGNAGAALAGMAAATGHKAVIFAPRTAPPAKIAQLLVFGARVLLVDGNYDKPLISPSKHQRVRLVLPQPTGYTHIQLRARKQLHLRFWEQVIFSSDLNSRIRFSCRSAMDNIFQDSQGFKGSESRSAGLIACRAFLAFNPKAQRDRNAFFSGSETIMPVNATTLADSISVDLPRDGLRALRAVSQTGGRYITVSDKSIIEGIARLGKEGLFVEPAASTAFVGLQKAVSEGFVDADDPVLVMLTGSGLKDIKSATMSVGPAPIIQPSLEAVKNALNL